MGNARFFEDVEFEGGERTKDFIFEKEYVCISEIDTCCDVFNYSYGFMIYGYSFIFSYKVFGYICL